MKSIFKRQWIAICFFFAPWSLYFLRLWPSILQLNDGVLSAGHPYVWADWSMHIALAANFAFRPVSHWFDSLPVYAGSPVTYPFITNLISGLLWRVSGDLVFSFIAPSIVATAAILLMLWVFFRSHGFSQWSSVAAAWIFLCSGGLGFFFVGVRLGWLTALTDATLVMTQRETPHLELNNIVSSMFIPQRAYLLGLPIGLLCLWWLRRALASRGFSPRWQAIAIGMSAGALLLIHTHTFLVMVLASGWLLLPSWKRWRQWCWYALPAALLSLGLWWIFLSRNIAPHSFFSVNLGWVIHTTLLDWVIFWLENWGIFLPLALIGTAISWKRRDTRSLSFILFFWLLFGLANVIQFQPQAWDNTKLFAWVYLGLTLPVVIAVQRLWRLPLGRVIAPLTLMILCVSGGVDLLHNLDTKTKTFAMLSAEEVELGTYIRTMSEPSAIFATAPSVTNAVSMIGGRSVLLGYPGWAFSYGLDASTREMEIRSLYADPSMKTRAEYLVVGPAETTYAIPNEVLLSQWELWHASPNYKIYRRL